jgi:hypothetical protein
MIDQARYGLRHLRRGVINVYNGKDRADFDIVGGAGYTWAFGRCRGPFALGGD